MTFIAEKNRGQRTGRLQRYPTQTGRGPTRPENERRLNNMLLSRTLNASIGLQHSQLRSVTSLFPQFFRRRQ